MQRLQDALRNGDGEVVARIERWLFAEGEVGAAPGDLQRLRYRVPATVPYRVRPSAGCSTRP